MKKYILKIIVIMTVAISFSAAAHSQVYVKVRPSITIGTRPARPSPRHVWVAGEWNSEGGRYSYKEGRWAEPPQHHKRYTEGHWSHTRRGYVWVPGRWR